MKFQPTRTPVFATRIKESYYSFAGVSSSPQGGVWSLWIVFWIPCTSMTQVSYGNNGSRVGSTINTVTMHCYRSNIVTMHCYRSNIVTMHCYHSNNVTMHCCCSNTVMDSWTYVPHHFEIIFSIFTIIIIPMRVITWKTWGLTRAVSIPGGTKGLSIHKSSIALLGSYLASRFKPRKLEISDLEH